MSRVPPLAAVLLVAALALPAAAAPSLEVTFALPAQADGGLAAAGPTWAVLLVRGGSLHAAVAGGTAVNHTRTWMQPNPLPQENGRSVDLPPQTVGAVGGDLAFPPGWGSLYVQADRIEVAAAGHAEVGHAAAGANADAFLPTPSPPGTYRTASHAVAREGAWTAWQDAGGAMLPVQVRATGLRDLEWHNGTLACAGCPTGGATSTTALGGGVALTVASYQEVQAQGGTLDGTLLVAGLATGGPSFDLAVAGSVRLPEASVQGACPDGTRCPDPAGRTLQATGNLTLAGLAAQPSDPNRLGAHLSGVQSARLDEAAAPAFGPAAAVAVGAALVALPFLLKLLVGLFARSARPPALQHPKRQALYDLVRSEPGLSFRALQRRLGWPHGTLSNHMARLLDVRLVTARRYRNTVRYFENHGRYDQTWGEAVLLRDPNLAALHAWLLAHPAASQGDVLGHWTAAGWKRSTVQDRLRTLAEGGLVEPSRSGRRMLYTAKPARLPGPGPAPPTGAASA